MSEIPKGKKFIDCFNDLGDEGWEMKLQLNRGSFLFMRRIEDEGIHKGCPSTVSQG